MNRVRSIAIAAISTGFVLGGIAAASPALAHGYVDGPKSRALLCKEGVNVNCGSVAYEPQSLEYLKGFPAAGPADGKIASANGQFGGLLDQQSSTRWAKTNISTGALLMDWTYTAAHATSGWSYYMTVPGWDQNAALTRASFERIATITHDGSKASTNPDHVINIPANRSGYHVILAVWDINDTVNAFYNVIDVNVTGEGQISAPLAPANPVARQNAAGGIDLNWTDTNSGRSGITYAISRDGVPIGTASATTFTDSGVTPGATYRYTVAAIDAQGHRSTESPAVQIQVAQPAAVDVIAPTVPSGLHAMEVTESKVSLMWGASSDASGAVTYTVYRDGSVRGKTNTTTWLDTQVTAGASYQYLVTAVDGSGNASGASNVLKVSTPAASVAAPAPVVAGTWSASAAYKTGDVVTFNGASYRAVQSYQGVGDPGWIYALSLWTPVSGAVVTPAPSPVVTPVPVSGTQWSATGSYKVGDRVTYNGLTYQAVTTYTGVGDPNWIFAPSLWKRV